MGTAKQKRGVIRRDRWHRNPRGKNYAEFVGITAEMERTAKKLDRLEILIADDARKRAEAADRWKYHQMRIRYCSAETQ